MSLLWLILGILLVIVGLLDVFLTVLNYDGFGFLSSRVYRGTWNLVRAGTKLLPEGPRQLGLSLGAPLMIPATMMLWMVIEILGFGFIYYSQINYFSFTSGAQPTFLHTIYFSGVTIGTLGYGDITPSNPVYGFLTFTHAIIGFSIITLFITYILNIYQVLQQWNTFASSLYHQADSTSDPMKILAPHFFGGNPQGLGPVLSGLHENVTSYYEGMRRYPIVYYFHSRGIRRSVPYVFRVTSETLSALRWGLPEDHPAVHEPQLPTLICGVQDVMDQMEDRFVPGQKQSMPEAVTYETFSAALREEQRQDSWLSRFLDMEHRMRSLARLEDPSPDPKEAYERYKEWLPFAHRTNAFVRAAARDLGYDPDELSWRSARDQKN